MTAAILPPLRDELTIHPGPTTLDGAPSWTLHDPLRNQFFRLSWPAFEMLSRWHLGGPEAVATEISGTTTLAVEAEDVVEMAEFLAQSQLLRPSNARDTGRLLAIAKAAKSSWAAWLLHHYLFFRVPLVRPDRLLGRLLPWTAWAGGTGFRIVTLLALVAGLFLVGRQWPVFTTTFVDHLSMAGLASFGLALALAKVVHELGHALTAKSMGCRVPTMGLAFLVMWPVLYTDVNEAWKLPDRRRRLLIGGAGILAELALAVWASLAWGLLPGGPVRAMAFTLAATTWVSSLAINLSPFMRFDGYFLMADALDMPNLHNRAFALGRWWLREALFDLGEPVPESLPRRRQVLLIAFAVAVWVYRLTLFLGIAVLVYHFFIKVVGLFLFAVEIGWFVMRPVAAELREWRERSGRIAASGRSRLTLGGLTLLLLLAVVPWQSRVSAPAMMKAAGHAVLYAPVPAMLVSVVAAEGERVAVGAELAVLDSPDLEYRRLQAERRIGTLKYELSSVSFDEGFRGRSRAITRELEAAQAELAAVARDKARLTLTAPIAGRVVDVSPWLQVGQWVNTKEAILSVRADGAVIEAYLAEEDLPRVAPGASASFLPEGARASVPAKVVTIDRTALRTLNDPGLAVAYGGAIPARMDRQALVPDAALYRVHLIATGNNAETVVLRGEVHMEGAATAPLLRVLRSMVAVVIREWGA